MVKPNKKPLAKFADDDTVAEPETLPVQNTVGDDFDDLVQDASEDAVEPEPDAVVDASDPPPAEEAEDEEPVVEARLPATPNEHGYLKIEIAPRVGIQVFLSENGADEGTRALWKRSRFFKQGRWQMTGKWIDPMTSKDINFEPKYWKEIR